MTLIRSHSKADQDKFYSETQHISNPKAHWPVVSVISYTVVSDGHMLSQRISRKISRYMRKSFCSSHRASSAYDCCTYGTIEMMPQNVADVMAPCHTTISFQVLRIS